VGEDGQNSPQTQKSTDPKVGAFFAATLVRLRRGDVRIG